MRLGRPWEGSENNLKGVGGFRGRQARLESDMEKERRKTCFVVGPIGADGSPTRGHADWLLDEIITPVFTEHFTDFDVVRSDKIAEPGMIDSQVINRLLDAELVIADMSFQNPNAFYEMGLRHMERKPIIHMFRAGEIIPFDVKPYRAIPFAFEHPKQRFEARQHLKQAVDAVLAADYQVENPVTRARGYAELSRHAMPGMDVILAEIDALKAGLQSVEQSAAVAQITAARALGSPPSLADSFRLRTATMQPVPPMGSLFGTGIFGSTEPVTVTAPSDSNSDK
jgi:hypothetical protein